MGTWGVKWYQDDLTLDIKDDYVKLVDIHGAKTASEKIFALYKKFLTEDEIPKLIITVALLQKEHNSLNEDLKSKAIECAQRMDYDEWNNHPRLEERKIEISRIIDYLERGEGSFEQNNKAKTKKSLSSFKIGNVYAHKIQEKYIYFVIFDINKYSQDLIVYIYNICSESLYDIETLKKYEYIVPYRENRKISGLEFNQTHKFQMKGEVPKDGFKYLGNIGEIDDVDENVRAPYDYMYYYEWDKILNIETLSDLIDD